MMGFFVALYCHQEIDIKDEAERFGTSIRSIQRDIALLKNLGIGLDYRDGLYRMSKETRKLLNLKI